MKNLLNNIKPKNVFKFFEDICEIPHVSFHTERIRDYVEQFAIERNLKYVKDNNGNIVVYKSASKGYENHDAVIIQGHLDMVGAKEDNIAHDFIKDPILLDEEAIKDGIITAKGTTLGGDDGIAVAYALAILDDNELLHPPIEALFTTNEEVGLLGATAFDCSLLTGKILLNIDSEDEGVFLMGSAGGMRMDVSIPLECVDLEADIITITVYGLKGGHSGDKIGTGRPSANVLMGRVIGKIAEKYDIYPISINGGVVDNAIADKCVARIGIFNPEGIQDFCENIQNTLNEEYLGIEDNISILVGFEEGKSQRVISKSGLNTIIMALKSMPQGVVSRNADDINMVETSLNLGILNVNEDGIRMGYSIRSSIESAKLELAERVEFIAKFLGGEVTRSGIYPAWSYNPVSKVRKLIGAIYKEQTGKEPVMRTIHAGLECGVFYSKIDGLDIVSYGPNLYDIHTFNERMEIDSVRRVYELTIELLRRL